MTESTMRDCKVQTVKSTRGRLATVVVGVAVLLGIGLTSVWSSDGTEFTGTVLTVDQVAGKFAVKKDGGGTRFAFVVTDKTTFSGTGLTSLKDLKKDDHVVVVYQVQGAKYLAAHVTKK
jgi:hypothetical protein